MRPRKEAALNNRFLTEKKTPVFDLANTTMVNRDEDLCVLSAHKPRTINLLQLALMFSLTCSSSIMAHAGTVTATGNVDPYLPYNGSISDWSTTSDVTVGSSSSSSNSGYLVIENGATVQDNWGFIAKDAGSIGTVRVDGSSQWINNGDLYVGQGGTGTMHITSGSSVSNNWGFIGHDQGSSGNANITGNHSIWINAGDLFVGYHGDGELNILDGADVSDQNGVISNDESTTGKATVSGTDSAWINAQSLSVGNYGNGSLEIKDGGVVKAPNVSVAGQDGSIGQITLTGTQDAIGTLETGQVSAGFGDASILFHGGMLKLTADQLKLFDGFTANKVSLADRGAIIDTNGFKVASNQGLTGSGDLTKTGEGTFSLQGGGETGTTGDLLVSQGTLRVLGGATVNDRTGVVDGDTTASAKVVVAGDSSEWNNTDQLIVAEQGEGRLVVRDAGTVSDNNAVIGQDAGSKGYATVTDSGSLLKSTNQLTVGAQGEGHLVVRDGGKATDDSAVIGQASGSTGTALVTGSDSKWITDNNLNVGLHGTGRLTVSEGATVSDSNAIIGHASDSNGTATVTGTDSSWDNSNHLTVGGQGEGQLFVKNGGAVTDTTTIIGHGLGSSGEMNVETGGTVTDTNAVIGQQVGSKGTATVTGTDSSWDNSNHLTVGAYGTGNLTVSDGGTVSDKNAVIGQQSGSKGTATVTGTDSSWDTTNQLIVATQGEGHLFVKNGGTVTDSNAVIGQASNSKGSATVSGDGSKWISSGDLDVGISGEASLNVETGAVVKAETTQVAQNSGSSGSIDLSGTMETGQVSAGGGTASFNFNGGKLVSTADQSDLFKGFHAGSVTIGTAGATIDTNSLQVASGVGLTGTGNLTKTGQGTFTLNGGGVTDTSADVLVEQGTLEIADAIVDDHNGIIDGAINSSASVTLSGSGSQWNSSHNLNVGKSGNGSLDVKEGAVVTAKSIFIGHQLGSDGTVTLTGADTQLLSDDTLHVGVHGTANLNVNDGAYVRANAVKVAEYSSSSGDIKLNNSTLETAQVSAGKGTASMSFNGATLKSTADQSDLFAGFATGDVTVGNAGATFDTQSHDVTTQIGLVGKGDFTKTGKGIFKLEGGATELGGDVNVNQGNLEVADGATVKDHNGVIDGDSTTTVTVSGTGSEWVNNNNLNVGVYGTAHLNVNDGAYVSADAIKVAENNGSSGTIDLYGTLETRQVSAGDGAARFNFNGGTLVLTQAQPELFQYFGNGSVTIADAGASVDTNGFNVTTHANISGTGDFTKQGTGTFTLNGDDFSDYSGELFVDQGTLVVNNHATLSDGLADIGDVAGDSAEFDLINSDWNSKGQVIIGDAGYATMKITDSKVEDGSAVIGHQADSVDTVTVDGSIWSTTGQMIVGDAGDATMTITDSTVVDGTAVIGKQADSIDSVTVNNSDWSTTGQMIVGDAGDVFMTITGSTVEDESATIGQQAYSSDSVTVNNSDWNTDNQFIIGDYGDVTMTIENGSTVEDDSAVIAQQADSTSTVVSVDGSKWNTTGQMTIGDGGDAKLTINTNAIVEDGSTVIANQSDSNSSLELDGKLTTTQVAAGEGSATVTFDGGNLELTANQSQLFNNIKSVNVADSGAFINTQNYAVASTADMSGIGGLHKQGTGELTLSGDDYRELTGQSVIEQGTLNFDHSFDLGGSLTVMAGSTLSHEQGGTIEGDLINSGAIYWVNLGQTINYTGNYTANPGATLSSETYLGGDSSATDRMAVNEDTSGTTAVTIRPIAGSPGAKTNVGIDVISVGGNSAGTFTLANTLKAGAFQYFLKQGGDGGNAGDWYLVSRYRDGVAGYVASQAINAEQGFASVSTYHQRRGGNIATDSDGRQSWLRTYGSRYSADGSDFASYDAHFYGFGLGQDLWVGQTNTGTQSRLALTADFSHANADLSNRDHNAGDMSGQTWSLGLDYSRLATSGTYLDVVGKVAHISNDFGIVDTGNAKQDGLRGTLSLETGIPVDLGGNWQIEPQAQLIYLHTRYDGFTDSVSDLPSYTADAVRGRIGARISTHALSDDNSQSDLYGIVNMIHDFTNGSSMNINGSKVSDDFGFSGYDVGLGGAYTVSNSTALYAQTVYRKAFDGNADGVSAYVGVKVKF
jgi:outer membrane autotransporter protein